jgi:homocysteine S-methyltransferase
MSPYRQHLPQLDGGLFLNDAGLETDLIFNHGIDIPEFAAHTLFDGGQGQTALRQYMEGFLTLARDTGAGFVLDTQTWRAQSRFCEGLAQDAAAEAQRYHSEQLGWLAETDVDMVTALTFTQADEAIGVVRAADELGLPVVVSFTVETDGNLPTGQSLAEAIAMVDDATNSAAAYYMVNCAHPDHFSGRMKDEAWSHRIRGIRCNASRMSHAELDESLVLDDGDPVELAADYSNLKQAMPWLNVFGGCRGSDLRHVSAIAAAVGG